MDLQKLNTLTKYPSILTYHQLRGGNKPRLIEERSFPDINSNLTINLFEKIDGENFRVIVLRNNDGTNDYFIGSREELVYAKGDRIITKAFAESVEIIKATLEHLIKDKTHWTSKLTVLYGESYGGSSPAHKQYTSTKTRSWRLFDAFSLQDDEFASLMELPREKIAGWRDHGHQPYWEFKLFFDFVVACNLKTAPLLKSVPASELPTTVNDAYDWMQHFRNTQVNIDAEGGLSEGVIVRSLDRQFIAKLRFEDYERTLRFKK